MLGKHVHFFSSRSKLIVVMQATTNFSYDHASNLGNSNDHNQSLNVEDISVMENVISLECNTEG